MTVTNYVFISVSLFTVRGSRRVSTYPVPRLISLAITQDNTEMMICVRITPLMTLSVRGHQVSDHWPSISNCDHSASSYIWLSISNTALASDTRRSRTEKCPGKNTSGDGKIVDNKRIRSFWYCEKGGKLISSCDQYCPGCDDQNDQNRPSMVSYPPLILWPRSEQM